jgi:hypothetical protein
LVYTESERLNIVAVVFNAANDDDDGVKPMIPEVKLDATELESPP